MAKEHLLRHNLIVYLNVCISVGHTNRALSTLLNYRDRTKKINGIARFLTIDLYNILLQGYADRGINGKIVEILRYIEEDKLKLNEQSFVAMITSLSHPLLCQISNITEKDRLDLIEKYVKQAEEDYGFTIHQIMDKSKFIGDQRSRFVEMIQHLRPDFQQQYTLPNLFYNNRLLNSLNNGIIENCAGVPSDIENNTHKTIDLDVGMDETININNKETTISTKEYNKDCIYTLDKLLEWAREQLAIELEGSITIKSIAKQDESLDNIIHVSGYA